MWMLTKLQEQYQCILWYFLSLLIDYVGDLVIKLVFYNDEWKKEKVAGWLSEQL